LLDKTKRALVTKQGVSPTLPYALLIDVKFAARPVLADLMFPPLS
jgi:hypothetical protein